MKKIDYIIKEEINRFIINESLSSVLYHFTDIYHLLNILKTNSINLSFVNDESEDMNNRYSYFLSLTRQRDGRLGYSHKRDVRITFDGDLLNHRFSGRPVNFWREGGKRKYIRRINNKMYDGLPDELKYQEDTENEDRLFSLYPSIKNVNRYIKRIDILLTDDSYEHICKFLVNKSEYRDFIHIFSNEKDFNSLNSSDINYKFSSNNDDIIDINSLIPNIHNIVNEYDCFISAILYLCSKNKYYDNDIDYDEYIKGLIDTYGKYVLDSTKSNNNVYYDTTKLFNELDDNDGFTSYYLDTFDDTILPTLYKSDNKRFCSIITKMINSN